MKVLHALEAFLNVSENWIYPQIALVPDTQPAILCREVKNSALFSPGNAPLFRDPPPWHVGLGIPRLINSLAYRLGFRHLLARWQVARWKPALIHAHFGMSGWTMLLLKRKLRVPLITSFYGVDAWQLPEQNANWRDRFRTLFAQGELFIAEGPAMKRRMEEIGCSAEKIRVVRLGVDLRNLPYAERSFAPPLRVAMLARFVEKKGLPDGLRACATVRAQGLDLRVLIIGDATDAAGEEIKRELTALAGTAELDGRVEFAGFQSPDRTRELLATCDIFLCPSKRSSDGDAEGGSPLSLTQAMAMGLLCVGTRHCDIPEVVIDGKTGFLATSGDVEQLAAALARVQKNPANAVAITRTGRHHIEQSFSIDQMVAALADLYAGVGGCRAA